MYNIRIPRAQEILSVDRKVHTAEHLASAMFYLGVPPSEIPRARLFAAPCSRTRPYAVLHPFASAAGKTWPRENFLAVAKHLRDQPGSNHCLSRARTKISRPSANIPAFKARRSKK